MQVLSPSGGKEAVSSSRLLIVDDDAYLRATLRQQLWLRGLMMFLMWVLLLISTMCLAMQTLI
jgi:hypothetical protein